MSNEENVNEETDYTKVKKTETNVPEKNIQKIVSGDVKVKKKKFTESFKDLFIAADFKQVVKYVCYEVFIPAARNMLYDGMTKGAERLIFREERSRRSPMVGRGAGSMTRITYNSPVFRENEGYRDPRTRPPSNAQNLPRPGRPDFLLQTKKEAEQVLDEMYSILQAYEEVTISDVHAMLGLQSAHTDMKWGWTDLRGSTIKQDRSGFWLDLPHPIPLSN